MLLFVQKGKLRLLLFERDLFFVYKKDLVILSENRERLMMFRNGKRFLLLLGIKDMLLLFRNEKLGPFLFVLIF